MRLESLDGATTLKVTILGYEWPDDPRGALPANWLMVDLSVQTLHGWGICRTACMTTWNAADFADWLEALGARPTETPSLTQFAFAEPNLQVQVLGQSSRRVRLHIIFILEQPGFWEMDDAPALQEGERQARHYCGEGDLTVRPAILRRAAMALRADLQRFPTRTPRA